MDDLSDFVVAQRVASEMRKSSRSEEDAGVHVMSF